MHQHHRHRQPQQHTGHTAHHRPRCAFTGHHGQHLAAGETQVGQQAKLLAPRQHLRAEAGGHTKQANRNCHRLQPVGHGKTAVKNPQRPAADVGGGRHLDHIGAARLLRRYRPHRLLHLGRVRAGGECQRHVVDAPVVREPLEVADVHRDGPGLAGIVAPHACYKKRSYLRLFRLR